MFFTIILCVFSFRKIYQNFNFSYGEYYDIDGHINRTIKSTDKVLSIKLHNLYYVDFPFIDEPYLKPADKYNYILVQEGKLPDKYKKWRNVYSNDIMRVKLYTKKT